MKDDFLMKNEISQISKIGTEEYISVLSISEDLKNQKSYYSILVSQDKVQDFMMRYSWDTSLGNGKPGFVFSGDNSEYTGLLYEGKENLVYYRTWSGKDDRVFEVSQEFILYFDLYKNGSNYVKIHNDGNEEDVILITGIEVKIKLKYLKEYLAVRNMKLLVYFEFMKLGTFDGEYFEKDFRDENTYYRLLVRELDSRHEVQSWLLGKKIVHGKSDFKPKLFEEYEYESFYIGTDEDGDEKYFTCNPDLLANYFGSNPDNPPYITPISFRRDVLDKYYANPGKYTVGDSTISLDGFWSLRIDNHLEDKVSVFLGDLGTDIPFSEQKYWKCFELKERGKISHTYYERSINGEFSDAEAPELFFKNKYNEFNKSWNKKYGWKFFKDFTPHDKYLLKSLHSLTSVSNQKEFDEQVLILTKIIIDYLNENEIYNNVDFELKGADDKSILKLEKFLASKKSSNERLIKFFKDLQLLRSKGSGHNKHEKEYKKAMLNFGKEDQSLKQIFDEILIQSIEMLNTLEIRFLK